MKTVALDVSGSRDGKAAVRLENRQPIHIVIATRFYPPDTGGGGIAAYAANLAKGLSGRGHRVRVISQQGAGSVYKAMVNGIEVRRIQARSLPYRCYRLPVAGRQTRLVNDLVYAAAVRRELLRLASEEMPDIVEYADIDAESLFHPYRLCPAVVKLHTPHFVLDRFYTRQERPYDSRGVNWAEKRSILKANALSSPSRHLALEVAAEYGIPAARVEWLANPIDTEFFAPPPGGSQRAPVVLFAGRLETLKGALVFAHAVPAIARACPTARFLFLGADRRAPNGESLKGQLLRYFAKQGIDRVDFEGHAPPERFREHYRHASVFVMPSLFENCPYTLLEAMACGCAIAVSRGYGMQEMIEDGNSGLFFEPGNSEDLAGKVIGLLANAELRNRLGKCARAAVLQRYSMESGAESAEGLYRRVIATWQSHPGRGLA